MNPDVWVVWPTVHPELSQRKAEMWKERGYRVAVLMEEPHQHHEVPNADRVVIVKEWTGFPIAANILCCEVPGNIVVVVGDDVEPDMSKNAKEIGEQFCDRFPDLIGVMQPTGDKYGSWDRCAVSPWIGREFINFAYGGIGPYWPEYFHYFCDEELQAYAEKLGCFQQREDLTQYHNHWQRQDRRSRPKHLRKAKRLWSLDRQTFLNRKAKGFPHDFNDAERNKSNMGIPSAPFTSGFDCSSSTFSR